MNPRLSSRLRLIATGAVLLTVLPFGNGLVGVAFSTTPTKSASDLPADGIYPQGRKLAFAGYSGHPARDLANGFTLAGPVYGDQQRRHQKLYTDRVRDLQFDG